MCREQHRRNNKQIPNNKQMRILTTGPRAAASIDATSHHSDPGQSAGRTKNINSSRSKGLMWRLCTDHVPINVATRYYSSDAHTRSQNTDRHTRTDAHNAKAPNNAAQSTPERTCCPFSRRLIDGSERSQTNHCPRGGLMRTKASQSIGVPTGISALN